MDSLLRDLRYALRQMVAAPVVSVVAILVLTVGTGTNALVFAVIDGVVFRAPPGVAGAEQLVEVRSFPAQGPRGLSALTWPEVLEYRDRWSAFGDLAAYRPTAVALLTAQGREMVSAELVGGAYFAVLQVRMALGTGFAPGDDRQTPGPAHAVLGFEWWQERMGGSPDVIGRRIEVNGRPYTVIGVAAERFHGARAGDDAVALWLPAVDHALLFPDQPGILEGERRSFGAVGRLAEGVSIARAEAVARSAWSGMAGGVAERTDGPRRIRVMPYRGVGSLAWESDFAVVGLVGGLIGGIILLIACVNVSGLLLGRALGRRREIGVRLALGAGRRRIVRQLLTESALLAGLAGAAGVLLTMLALDALERSLFTFPIDLAPGFTTLALTLATVGATAVLFGLAPALHATRASAFTAMKDDVAGQDRRSRRMRAAFTVAQLALSLPLLTAAGLLVGRLVSSTTGDYGIADPESVLSVRIELAGSGYTADEVGPLLTDIRERVDGLPGVAGAAFTSAAPLGGLRLSRLVRPPSASDGGATSSTLVRVAVVDPQYFATMGVSILRGRGLEASDVPGGPLVAVVDEGVSRRWWQGQDPIGRTLEMGTGDEAASVRVVGVVAPVRMEGDPGEETPVIYAARRQLPDTVSMTLVVRAAGPAGAVAPAVRAAVREVDPDLITRLDLLSARLRAGRTELAHASAGAAACGLLALILACVGLYGTIATGVSERTHEIGVRMALGADRPRLILHFVRRGLVLALVALGVGLPLSWMAIALVGAGIVGAEALAPEVPTGLALVGLLMVLVAAGSSWLPARRSSGVDPVRALRSE